MPPGIPADMLRIAPSYAQVSAASPLTVETSAQQASELKKDLLYSAPGCLVFQLKAGLPANNPITAPLQKPSISNKP